MKASVKNKGMLNINYLPAFERGMDEISFWEISSQWMAQISMLVHLFDTFSEHFGNLKIRIIK